MLNDIDVLLQATQKEDIKDFTKVIKSKVKKKKKKKPQSQSRYLPIRSDAITGTSDEE